MNSTQSEIDAFVRRVFDVNANLHPTVKKMKVFHVPAGKTCMLRGAIDCETAKIEGTLINDGGCLYAKNLIVGPGGHLGPVTRIP